jgi:very-short-patch-repair endonuclease
VTSVARTILDCAASVRFDLLEKFLERSEELELFDLRQVEETIRRASHHPGVGPLRKAIDLYKPTSFSRSTAERVLLSLIREVGLPQPRPNYVEEGYELDFYWPELRFAVELDLYETHGTRAAFERDRERQEDLKLAGIELVRVTGRRLEREPKRVIERIGRLLAQRACQPVA